MGQERGAGSAAVPCRQDASHEDGAMLTLPATSRVLESGMDFSGSGLALVVPLCPRDSQRSRVFAKRPLQQQVLLSSAARAQTFGPTESQEFGKTIFPFPSSQHGWSGDPSPTGRDRDPKSPAASPDCASFPPGLKPRLARATNSLNQLCFKPSFKLNPVLL